MGDGLCAHKQKEEDGDSVQQATEEGKMAALFIADHAPDDCRNLFLARPDVKALLGA